MLPAAYILSPEIVYEHMQRHSESSYSSYANWTQDLYKWVSCHANDLDSLILSSYIAGTARGRPWLVQRLGDVVLPKIEAPVVKGLVLLNRAELQVADDALAGRIIARTLYADAVVVVNLLVAHFLGCDGLQVYCVQYNHRLNVVGDAGVAHDVL